MTTHSIDMAYAALGRGDGSGAVNLLRTCGAAGDPACWVELATWYLDGRYLPRDLAQARDCFKRAGDLGHAQARRIHMALVANGVGGPRNWSEAMQDLTKHADDDEESAREFAIVNRMNLDDEGRPRTPARRIELSSSPVVIHFPELLTPAECDYLIQRALPLLQPSVIVDPATGNLRPHPVRTSENAMFPWVFETPAVHAINQRLAFATGTQARNGEPLQILRYRPGQEYRPHHDALPNTDNQRVLTFLLYLNSGYEGGATQFCRTGPTFAGQMGDGLLFRNTLPSGAPDPSALHAGLPVSSGEKYLATRWIREKAFGPS
jgi:prolyl 4-hydroxylase